MAPVTKTSTEVQLRETLDALNGTATALHKTAATEHTLCEQSKRTEFRLEALERSFDRLGDHIEHAVRAELKTGFQETAEELATKNQVAIVVDAITDVRRRTEEIAKDIGIDAGQLSQQFTAAIKDLDERLGARIEGLGSHVDGMSATVVDLKGEMVVLSDRLERTDDFRNEVLDRASHALTSKPAMATYALLGFLVLQRIGGSNDSVREFLARYLLGVPAPITEQQPQVAGAPADGAPAPAPAATPALVPTATPGGPLPTTPAATSALVPTGPPASKPSEGG